MKPYSFPDGYTPLTVHDFDIPPLSRQGDTNVDDLYRAVGRSLSQWEMVETALVHLFAHLLHPERPFYGPAIIATRHVFGTLASPSARTDVIQSAAAVVVENRAHVTRLKSHLKIVSKAGARRNEIAHGVVLYINEYDYFLVPHNHNPRKTIRDTVYSSLEETILGWAVFKYNSEQVNEFGNRFTRLFRETWNLSLEIANELRTSIETRRIQFRQHILETSRPNRPATERPPGSSRK